MSEKSKIFIEDIILITMSIIGVGFASGAEIAHFFCYPIFPILILIFLIFFVFYFNLIYNFKTKHNIKSFFEFNNFLFPKQKFLNKCFTIFYLVLGASMLAGADNIMLEVLGLNIPVVSILLCVVSYVVVTKGVDGIRKIFSKFVPILLLAIFTNLFVNSFYQTNQFKNLFEYFNFKNIDISKNFKYIIYPILFFGSNFVFAINSIISTRKNNKKISCFSTIMFAIFLLLGCVVVMSQNSNSSMPLLYSASNLSGVFFYLYFACLILTIFASFTLSVFNQFQLINSPSNLSLILILFANQIVSFLGFKFIIKYLYLFTGFLGMIYLIILFFKIKKINKNNNQKNRQIKQ